MMKIKTVLGALLAAASIDAAVIEQVIVRQQWPWSTDVKVEYKLSGVTSPVDISVKVYNGNVELDSANLDSAMIGDRYGISEDGVGTIIIDPVKAFGNSKVALANFKVKLSVADSAENVNDVLYKVFNLENGECEDVTRAQLLNGEKGSIETDYKKFTGYDTPASDVIIWTEVTNNVKYATTHIVLRKIPAKGERFMMGSPEEEPCRSNTDKSKIDGTVVTISGRETQHEVLLNKDFYMGVFEVTQYQWWRITGAWPSAWSLEECRNERPVEKVSYDDIRGTGIGSTWPTNNTHEVLNSSFLGLLRGKFEGAPKFDLPTEAQWEYACRAKSVKSRYNGSDCANAAWAYLDANLKPIARFNMNGGYLEGSDESIPGALLPVLGTTNGTARVGSYLPNAYGLYDMLGNVGEWCLDWYAMFTSGTESDPSGPAKTEAVLSEWGYANRSIRGGYYASRAGDVRAAYRSHDTWSQKQSIHGFRLCLTVEE